MIRATGTLAFLTFAAVAGAQPAKPAKADTSRKPAATMPKAAAPAAKPAAAPVAAPVAPGKAPAMKEMKHDSSKKAPTTKKPGG